MPLLLTSNILLTFFSISIVDFEKVIFRRDVTFNTVYPNFVIKSNCLLIYILQAIFRLIRKRSFSRHNKILLFSLL